MEMLNRDIENEERARETKKLRFADEIRQQVDAKKDAAEEKDEDDPSLRSRADFLRQTNEMAQRLKNWDWNERQELGVRIS